LNTGDVEEEVGKGGDWVGERLSGQLGVGGVQVGEHD